MGSFALASQGYPQNASVQNQFANALNATVNTYAPITIAGGTSTTPLLLNFTPGTVGATYLAAGAVVGDTGGPGRGRLVVATSGYGALIAQTGAGVVQANLYGAAGGQVDTDYNLTVNSTTYVNGTLTLAGGSTPAGATVNGTFTCNGTVFGVAPSIRASGTFLTNTANLAVHCYDDSTASYMHLDMNNNAGTSNPAVSRQTWLRSVDINNNPAASFTLTQAGHIGLHSPASGFYFSRVGGGTLSRISEAHTPQFSGTSPALSHGLGTTPDALVATESDGGGFGGTFGLGFFNLGSSTVTIFTQTNGIWARILAVKFGG